MVSLPTLETPGEYLLVILSVTITTLGLLTLAGILRSVFGRHKTGATFRKKFWFFPIFVIGIFAMGWVSATAQEIVYAYLQQNVATSISGLIVAILVAWFLYDWAIWRSGR